MNNADVLRELEESLLRSSVRRDAERVAVLLAEEFCEFGSSGAVYTRDEIISSLQSEGEDVRLTMKDFACRMVAEGVALVTYRSAREVEGEDVIAVLRSSLWVFRDARWQMGFHQGTRVKA